MEIKQAVLQVYRALEEKGYNPINQLVGYILSEDPTYITTYKNARAIIRRIFNRICKKRPCALAGTQAFCFICAA